MRPVKNALAVLAVFLFLIFQTNPSFAHTEVESTSPAAGETVAPGEQVVSVQFTDKILELANSTEILVVDPSGNEVHADCSGVEENRIYTNAFLPTEGDYEVTWRTLAEDGHPISGKFSFSVSGNAETEYTTPACATDTPTTEPTPTVIATPPASETKTAANTFDALSPFVGSGLAVVGVAVVAWLLFRRSRKPKA